MLLVMILVFSSGIAFVIGFAIDNGILSDQASQQSELSHITMRTRVGNNSFEVREGVCIGIDIVVSVGRSTGIAIVNGIGVGRCCCWHWH